MIDRLREFLELIDVVGVELTVWTIDGGEECKLWRGLAMDTPFWIVNLMFDYDNAEDRKPICISNDGISVLVK